METEAARFRHDLRTPLNHLIGYGEMLIETLEDDASFTDHAVFRALRDAVARARELVLSVQSLAPDELQGVVERAGLENILTAAGPLLAGPHADDLRRMNAAAAQLAGLVSTRVAMPSAAPVEPVMAAVTPGATGHLLAVDDNTENRELLRRMLERQGYTVTTAAGGEECLDLLRRNGFDLVLLDVIMPGMTGFDVLSRMRENGQLAVTPVIVISALDESSAAIRCIHMGAEDYLPKPFDPVLLRARIGATLEKKRLRDQEARYAKDLENALAELRGTKDKLVVQEKLASLGALTAGIAHELKNPLNFITNFSSVSRELLKELEETVRAGGDATELLQTLEENLERVETHGKRADRIVRGMLLHSHGQPGQREPADINGLVEEALTLAYHGMRAQDSTFNITIEKRLAENLPQVPVVTQDISRVLVNILNNAFYATEEKKRSEEKKHSEGEANGSKVAYAPRILASTGNAGEFVEIVLEDNGSGIPEEAKRKIFDPFFTTKPAGSGTGLGLSISYDIIVRTHEGVLNVESAPDEFTRFIIRLPRVARA